MAELCDVVSKTLRLLPLVQTWFHGTSHRPWFCPFTKKVWPLHCECHPILNACIFFCFTLNPSCTYLIRDLMTTWAIHVISSVQKRFIHYRFLREHSFSFFFSAWILRKLSVDYVTEFLITWLQTKFKDWTTHPNVIIVTIVYHILSGMLMNFPSTASRSIK